MKAAGAKQPHICLSSPSLTLSFFCSQVSPLFISTFNILMRCLATSQVNDSRGGKTENCFTLQFHIHLLSIHAEICHRKTTM